MCFAYRPKWQCLLRTQSRTLAEILPRSFNLNCLSAHRPLHVHRKNSEPFIFAMHMFSFGCTDDIRLWQEKMVSYSTKLGGSLTDSFIDVLKASLLLQNTTHRKQIYFMQLNKNITFYFNETRSISMFVFMALLNKIHVIRANSSSFFIAYVKKKLSKNFPKYQQ